MQVQHNGMQCLVNVLCRCGDEGFEVRTLSVLSKWLFSVVIPYSCDIPKLKDMSAVRLGTFYCVLESLEYLPRIVS